MCKTNILHIIDTLGIGGAEKIMVGVINGLPEFEHHVVYLNGSDALAANLPENCRVVKLDYRSKWDFPRCIIRLRKYIRQNEINIVHSHLYLATLIARTACPKDVKLFTTIHSLPSKNYFAENRFTKLFESLTYKKRHNIIAICHEVFADYNKCIRVKGAYNILYNYVEDKFMANDYKRMNLNGTLRLVAVGNLRKVKNYGYLIEAFKKLPVNVHLDIYGAGPLKNELQEEIDKHKLNIRLCGVREDIQNVLPQYDAFIMSSIFEGQPISLLEAMACGIPAILSDIPVLREVTDNQAIFYSLTDINDLVSKVTSIANHEIDLDEVARLNFERVQKIASKTNYMKTLRDIYLSKGSQYYTLPKRTPVIPLTKALSQQA